MERAGQDKGQRMIADNAKIYKDFGSYMYLGFDRQVLALSWGLSNQVSRLVWQS